MTEFTSVCAIVVAAGGSSRMQGKDKILLPLAGKPVLAWSVDILQQSGLIDRIVIVCSPKNLAAIQNLAVRSGWAKVEVCLGGERRQDSVAAGLKKAGKCEWVIIHDGARPLITADIIRKGLAAAVGTGAAAAAVHVKDTIKMAGEDDLVIKTLPREQLRAIQTPQVFRFAVLESAHRRIKADVTDDASMVEMNEGMVKLYEGSYRNLKITTEIDLKLAEYLLTQ